MAETKTLNLASFEDVEELKQTTKTQGNEISQVKNDLAGHFTQKYVLGNIDDSTGNVVDSKRVVTDGFIRIPAFCASCLITFNNNYHSSGYSYRLYEYNSDETYIGTLTDWLNSAKTPIYTLHKEEGKKYKIKIDDISNSGADMPSIEEVQNDVIFLYKKEQTEYPKYTYIKDNPYVMGQLAIVTNGYPNIDTQKGVLDFGDNLAVTIGEYKKYLHTKNNYNTDIRYVNLRPDSSENDYMTSNVLLVYNINEEKFRTVGFVYRTFNAADIIVGGIKINNGTTYNNFISANLPFVYTVDGNPPIEQKIKLKDGEITEENLDSNIGINDRLPDFLEDEYRETVKSVFEKSTINTFSFGFATDLHFSAKGSGYAESELRDRIKRNFIAMSKISKEIPLDTFVLGGDYQQQPQPNYGQTKQQGIDVIYDVNRWFSKIDCLHIAIPGNHELNYAGTGTGYGLTDDEIFCLLEKKYISNSIKKANKFVFYSISEESQVVYVYIARGETDYSTEVENGLKVVIEKNIEKYPLIIFNHYSVTNNGELSFQIVIKSIDYLLENNAEIIAWIGGHNHSDWDNTYKNVLVISCLQSGAWSNEPSKNGTTYEHINETSTESAFSIFTVDKTNKKIYCTRFGLGDDREWSYS